MRRICSAEIQRKSRINFDEIKGLLVDIEGGGGEREKEIRGGGKERTNN